MLPKIISAVGRVDEEGAHREATEKLTGVFVPIIVYLSLVVLAVWLAVVLSGHAYPGNVSRLAVPCASAVGNGIAARAGIVPSGGGEAFLGATGVRTVAFDKTGTLTVGNSISNRRGVLGRERGR